MKISLINEESIDQAVARRRGILEPLASVFDPKGPAPEMPNKMRGFNPNPTYRPNAGGNPFAPRGPVSLPQGVALGGFQTPAGIWSPKAGPNVNSPGILNGSTRRRGSVPSATSTPTTAGNPSGIAKPQMSSPLPTANPQGGLVSGGLEATPKFSQPKTSLRYGTGSALPTNIQQLPTQFKTPYTSTQIKSGGISTAITQPGTSLNVKPGTPTPTSAFSGGQGNLPFMNPAEVIAGDAASRAANIADIQRTVATQKAAGTYKPGTAYQLAGSSVQSEVKGVANELRAGNITRAQAVQQVKGIVGQSGVPKVNPLSIPTANSPGVVTGKPLAVGGGAAPVATASAPVATRTAPVATASAPVATGTAPVATAGTPVATGTAPSSVVGAAEKTAGSSALNKVAKAGKGIGKVGVLGAAYYGADMATQAIGNALGLRDPNKEGPQVFDTVSAPVSWGGADMALKAGSNIVKGRPITSGLGKAFGQGAVGALAYSGGSKLGGMAADALGIKNEWGRLGFEAGGGIAGMVGANMAQTAAPALAGRLGLGAAARLGLRALGPIGAVIAATEAGWEAGRAIGNNVGGSKSAQERTKEMGVVDLAKETFGLGGSDTAKEAAIDKAGQAATERQKKYFASGGREKLAADQEERNRMQGAEGDKALAGEYKKLGSEKFKEIYGQKELDTISKAGLVSENYKGKRKMSETEINKKLFETIQQITSSTSQAKTPAAATLKPNPEAAFHTEDEVNPVDETPEKDKTKKSNLYEIYLNKLKTKLKESEGYEGINPEAYGHNLNKIERVANKFKEPMNNWRNDSNTVEDLPAEKTDGTNAEAFVKQKVIDLMSAAQEEGVEMTHGEAHQMAIKELKKHLGQAN